MKVRTWSRSHILQEFKLHCQSLAASDNRGFKQEFEELNDVGKEFTCKAGELEVNKEKNRYPFILPYDHCRVRLSIHAALPNSDYINANFVPGGGSERDFICTQAPLPNTTADFWKMVWEQNVRIIVMVTALKHKDMVFCYPYWPLERGTLCYGLHQVTTLSRKQGPDYFITTLSLRQRGCAAERLVTHYHYPAWPDRAIPKTPSSLCALTELVRQHLDTIPRLGPAIVHCSAGVGRSGTFVALLWLMQLCARGIQPDVRAAVDDLRRHRMWMVQTLEQYIFIHQCLLYWLSQGVRSPTSPHSPTSPVQVDWPQTSQRVSSGRGEREARRQHQQPAQQKPHAARPRTTTPHPLQPARDLLRRLIPSTAQLKPRSHT